MDAELFKIISPMGSWILVIIGWFFVRYDNNKRESRKELRNELDSIIILIDKIEEKAREYYKTPPGNSSGLALEIKSSIKRLGMHIKRISDSDKKYEKCKEHLLEYRIHVTSNDFECSSREPKPESHQIYIEIADSAINLQDALENAFKSKK
ncbi:hypothetical protein [Laribacter hongkongensis]|uniref:hypothetical protein n=1 Tax=Laribacter hongkongensis TaxID=168471 RepID=UPI00117F5770|nr:hypothetical protein [Laribacter hongkongensis]